MDVWKALEVLAQGVGSLLVAGALVFSVVSYRRSSSVVHYGELDRMYFDLLRAALDNPGLRDPAGPSKKDRPAYEIYAFMVWNFLEAIYDRGMADRWTRRTWYPIVQMESKLHRSWFDRAESQAMFKPEFRAFIASDGFARSGGDVGPRARAER